MDQCVTQPRTCLSKVHRLQFLRSIQTVVKEASLICCEIICGGEFNESVGIHDGFTVALRVHSSKSIVSIIEVHRVIIGQCLPSKKGDGATVLKFPLPACPAFYSVVIAPRERRDDITVLPLISDVFQALRSEEYQSYVAQSGPFIPRHLGCYRTFVFGNREVLVKEEYGVTLGSHIYDSSIVLTRYLERNITELVKVGGGGTERMAILDLGAGCGMVGLCIAALLSEKQDMSGDPSEQPSTEAEPADHVSGPQCTVYVTDRSQQKGLIEHNISINPALSQSHTRLQYADLDWADAAQLEHIVYITQGSVCLIVAGDVFYDREVAGLFFNAARALSTHNIGAKVLVAQKLRLNGANQAAALITEEEIRSECGFANVSKVSHEADVILWSLSM